MNQPATTSPDPRDFKYVTECIGTDRYPYEIVRVISDKTIVIKPMFYWIVEGSAACERQVYGFRTIDDAMPIRVRRSKRGHFKKGSAVYALSNEPNAYRDPTF